MKRSSGVEGGSPWSLKWSTRRRRASFGHNSGSPDGFCPISPPGTVLMGRERQRDEIRGLEVVLSGCGCKDSVYAAESGVFEAEQDDL